MPSESEVSLSVTWTITNLRLLLLIRRGGCHGLDLRLDSSSAGRRFDPYTAHQISQRLPHLLLSYANLVPTHGANFFKLSVELIHKTLLPAEKPLRIMIQRRTWFGMGQAVLRRREAARYPMVSREQKSS